MRFAPLLAAWIFFVTMVGTTLPTPLYPIYEKSFGIAPPLIPVIFAVYAVAVIAGLMLFGKASDEIGRKPVLLVGLVLSAGSAIAFLLSHSLTLLFVGRVLSGLSAGIFTGTATAALVEILGEGKQRIGAMLAVGANTLGLGSGTLLSGLLARYAALPLRLPYAADLLLVALGLVAIVAVPETVSQRSGRFQIQRLRVPRDLRPIFVRAAIAGMCAFAVSGLFSAVVPSFFAKTLHESNPALPGITVFLLFLFTAVGQLAMYRLPRASALAIACAALVAGVGILAAGVVLRSEALTFLSAAIEGAGQGLALGFGLAEINERVREGRGEVSSAYFVTIYIALALPVVGAGLLAGATSIPLAALVFCAVVGLVVCGVLVSLAKSRALLRAG
jgi:predicted MFS family arabinose efflux permease